jgi:multiple antibiotic resistance protein
MEFLEEFSIKETMTAFMVLFAVILGSVPIIVSLRQKFGRIESEKAAIVAGLLMISFSFYRK